MIKRDRVICAIKHVEPDIIPHNIYFTTEAYAKMAAYYGDDKFIEKINNHIAEAGCDNFLTQTEAGFYKDIFGVVWDKRRDKDIGVISNYVLPGPEITGFTLPDIDEKKLRANYAVLSANKESFRFAIISFSLFERAWTLCGMENVLTYMLCEKSFLHGLLDLICERNLKIIKIALEYDIDGFHFGDDWGQQKGMIMGPVLWREFIKPRLQKMYAPIKNAGKFVSQHSCGDISEIFPDLIDTGLDVYQTFQPEIYDIAHIKKKFGSRLTFWGGISTQRVLAHGSAIDVRNEMLKTMKTMGKDGGYILAPTHAVPGDVSAENIDIFIKIANNQANRLYHF